MATAVTVDDETKSRLEALQAEIHEKTGKSVTETELIERLVDDAYESRAEIIASFQESAVPLTEAEKSAMEDGRFSSGVETDEDDIDEILYG